MKYCSIWKLISKHLDFVCKVEMKKKGDGMRRREDEGVKKERKKGKNEDEIWPPSEGEGERTRKKIKTNIYRPTFML